MALYGLEIILTFVQALIFSTLTLVFMLIAIESHHDEEGHMGEESMDALEDARHHHQPSASRSHRAAASRASRRSSKPI